MLLSCIVKFSNLLWYDVISFINSLQCQNEMSLRLAYYPPFEKGAEPLPRQLRYGEHTDYTGWECAGSGPGWQWWHWSTLVVFLDMFFWICFFGYVFDVFHSKKNSIAWSFPMEASLFFEGVKPQRPSRWENRSHMNLSTATVRRLHAALARPQYRWPGPKKSQSIESTIVQEHLILRFRWKRREMRAVR